MRLPLHVLFCVFGAVLSALPAAAQYHASVMAAPEDVRETLHDVSVVFRGGLAAVTVDMSFARTDSGLSQVGYALPIPDGAELSAFRVCNDHGCRRGLPDSGAGEAYDLSVYAPAARGSRMPIGTVRRVGTALELRVAPLGPEAPVQVQVQYLAPTELVGGVERLDLPAREPAPALRRATVRLAARGSTSVRIDGQSAHVARTTELGRAVRLEASWAEDRVTRTVTSARCGDAECGRVRVAAGPRAAGPISANLLVDVSPSMLDVPQGRLGGALRAIAAALPPLSTLRPVLFARHARSIRPEPEPAEGALDHVGRVLRESRPESWLGPSTRIESALPMLLPQRGEGARPVILVGDGTIHGSPGAWAALDHLVASGVQLNVINLADGPVDPPLAEAATRSGGLVVELGSRGDDPAEARRRLVAVVAPIVVADVWVEAEAGRIALGPLRAGEELTWEGRTGPWGPILHAGGRSPARRATGASARGLAVRLGRRFSRRTTAGDALTAVDRHDLRLARKRGAAGLMRHGQSGAGLAPPEARVRVPRLYCGCRVHITGALSRQAVQRRMQSLGPRVRGCFREARRGRPEYRARVTYHLVLAGREVESARVSGNLTPDLEACLLSAVDDLHFPPTPGQVVVSYPFVTRGERRAGPMSLPNDVAAAVDALF